MYSVYLVLFLPCLCMLLICIHACMRVYTYRMMIPPRLRKYTCPTGQMQYICMCMYVCIHTYMRLTWWSCHACARPRLAYKWPTVKCNASACPKCAAPWCTCLKTAMYSVQCLSTWRAKNKHVMSYFHFTGDAWKQLRMYMYIHKYSHTYVRSSRAHGINLHIHAYTLTRAWCMPALWILRHVHDSHASQSYTHKPIHTCMAATCQSTFFFLIWLISVWYDSQPYTHRPNHTCAAVLCATACQPVLHIYSCTYLYCRLCAHVYGRHVPVDLFFLRVQHI